MTTDTGSNGALDIESMSTSMTVKDVEKSAEWYHKTLGFTIEQRREREGKVFAIALSAGAARMLLNQDDGAKGFERIKGQGISLYFTTQQSVDDIAERATSNGATLQVAPQDMPWGVRMMIVLDPDGFKLVFAKPLAQ